MQMWKWLITFVFFSVSLQASEARYVTAGGTITEIVFALNKGKQVVGVDQSSSYPDEIANLPVVGYYRDLAAEGVLSTGLTHLLALEGTGREQALQQIQSAGVTVHHYPKPVSVEGLFTLIEQIASDIDAKTQARVLIEAVKSSLPEKQTSTGKRALFLLSAGERGLIAAGMQTVPQVLFDYVGLENVASHNGFKGIGIEALTLTQPDFIVAPEHVVGGAGGREAFCAQPSLALIEAAVQCKLLVMDSLMSLGMTVRISEAIEILNRYSGKQ